MVIDPALIHLDAAVGYAVDGSVEDGCQLAANVLESLPSEHRTRIVMTRGRDVLDALPASRQPSPAVGELRELLSADVAS
ncbi:hypothetical protein [Nocardia otitidiscaviarum]|uniref:hypothetical protein n=1 Tax=Nocardia otitidiscaviarum TaxID=1823 RepID=UPI0011DE12A6|nr:hypothetical protein [Nocardia otitidiscaviarum]